MSVKSLCLLVLVLTSTNCFNFCQVETVDVRIFTTQKQMQQLPLHKYVRGYDLEFTSSNPNVAQVFEPYHLSDQGDVPLKAGYNIVNVDGKNSHNRLWTRQGIVFAEGGTKNVAIGYGQFSSGVLPKIEGFNYLQLPQPSNCYSGLIYNQNLDTVIDCEKIAQKQQDRIDLTCVVDRSGKIACKKFGSITKTSKRRSVVYSLANQKYLMSAALTDHVQSGFQNQTFINIFRLSDQDVGFNLIVDRRTLDLHTLSITDIDLVIIDGLDYVVLSDTDNRLVIFRYTQDNDIQDVVVVPVEGSPRQFVMSAQGTWLIATATEVLDCAFSPASQTLQILRRYELDPTDTQITDLQSSYMYLAVRTSLNRLYTFDRKQTQLKYLLNRQEISAETAVVVSPFYPRLFQINNTKMISVAISSGYLLVSQVDKSTDVQITAYSGSISCTFNVRIQLVQPDTKIYQKKQMTSSYRLQSGVPASFLLSDYFGGTNLEYKVTKSSQDIQYDIQHINKYAQQIKYEDETILLTKVVDIDKLSYWFATFTNVAAHFHKCQLDGKGIVTCKQNVDQIVKPNGLTFKTVDAIMRTNGDAVISWSYQNSNRLDYKKFGNRGLMSMYRGYVCRYSQVLVGQKYTVYVQKQLSTISFFNEKTLKLQAFTKNDFTAAQLASMGGGFYPREIMDSHTNPQIFYIKFPISIVTISYTGGRQFQVLSHTPISKTYIPDEQWAIVVGKYTILLFTPNMITELAVLADSTVQQLHKIQLNKRPLFPVKYEIQTDTAYFQCSDGTIQYIRLNQPSLDSKYYSLSLAKQPVTAPGQSNWDVSGSWLVTSSGQVFYQYEQPILVISTTVPDSSYREDLSLSLSVMSENQKKDVVANVTAFNYPAKIQASSVQDNGLVLPEKGEDQLIPFPIDKYFTGSITTYRITCPYCMDGNIQLVPPIRLIGQNAQLNNFSAVVGLQDNSGALVIKQNVIYMVNLANVVQASKNIQTVSECSLMGINEGYLVVYCGGSNQQLFIYQVVPATKSITLLHNYLVPADAGILKPSEIGLHKQGQTVTAFIHDGDLMDNNYKNSNIKVFKLTDAIEFKGVIDSTTFKLPSIQPINSMSIHNRVMLVTIGDKGIGYLNMVNYETSAQFVNLRQTQALRNYTLDNTQYLRVVLSQQIPPAGLVHALITTSNSFNYLIQFGLDDGGVISFKRIVQTYNRYGHQTSLNWALLDSQFVMIGYYNKTTSMQTLALYKRNTQKVVDFYTSHQTIIPEVSLRIPKAALLHAQTISEKTSFLYLGIGPKPSSQGSLGLFNVTQQFHLLAKYDSPGSFDKIYVNASNDYYTVTRTLSVEFEGGSAGGVKWYAIVIVVILVAIGVGVAFGLYLKMKRKKADSKKVSLFTENEEVDEQV